ncbi:MAG: hypothetical protein WKF89_15780 [Chitinophagaceae bacterium]
MKTARFLLLFGFLAFLVASISCQKGNGSTTPAEENLVVETLPLANGHVESPAPGPTFPLKVTVKSAMPSGGVKIDVTAKPDGGTVNFFNNSVTTMNATTDFTITGATAGVTAVVDITVTSVSKSSNRWTGSYKFSRK